MPPEGDFAGRLALVTGGSGGIGAAICRALAAAGAQVAVGYGRSAEPAQALAAELGGGAQAFGADLADPAAPALLVSAVEEAMGGIDVL
ncbi:MAG TPA: SDR family NAD(P)-dependent oxidoreductase, partial [Solirubrobacteraceae bacterium]|nr:SDR family NAD(P)-dependent oxidoreductase [Solirubrobacteraceae bacterium]